MKLSLVKSKEKYSLIRLYLLKYQSHSNRLKAKIGLVESCLKHALKIIYCFHYSRKKIWFIGLPHVTSPEMLRITKNSNHVFLPKSVWPKGLIGNKKFVVNSFNHSKRTGSKSIFKQPDLLVVFGIDKKTSEALREFRKVDIPVVVFGSSIGPWLQFNYFSFVPIKDFENKLDTFCFLLVYSLLKKTKKLKGF